MRAEVVDIIFHDTVSLEHVCGIVQTRLILAGVPPSGLDVFPSLSMCRLIDLGYNTIVALLSSYRTSAKACDNEDECLLTRLETRISIYFYVFWSFDHNQSLFTCFSSSLVASVSTLLIWQRFTAFLYSINR